MFLLPKNHGYLEVAIFTSPHLMYLTLFVYLSFGRDNHNDAFFSHKRFFQTGQIKWTRSVIGSLFILGYQPLFYRTNYC